MEKINKISGIMAKITKATALISFVGIVFLVIINVADVIMQKVQLKALLGAYELSQRALMCTVFAAFAYAQTKKAHINMTILITHFPRALRFTLFSVMQILSTVAAGAMTYALFHQAGVYVENGMATEILYIPLFPFYYLSGAAMVIFTLAMLYDSVLSCMAIGNQELAEQIQSEWS